MKILPLKPLISLMNESSSFPESVAGTPWMMLATASRSIFDDFWKDEMFFWKP
jgi:hypothetical protein